MNPFANSWNLVKASFNVLRSDKELLIYPLISFIGVVLVMCAFAFPFIGVIAGDMMTQGARGRSADDISAFGQVTLYLLGFLFYIVTYFVIFFCNTALVGAAMIRLRGGDPTLSDGFKIAASRAGTILGYAAISATVGMILDALRDRGGIIGSIAASIFAFAWNVISFLAIPVLVVENVGPIDAVKRSTDMLKRTWGENLVVSFGMNWIFGWIMALGVLMGVGTIALGIGNESSGAVIFGVILMVVWIAAVGLFSGALNGIFRAALYLYAAEGTVAGGFEEGMMTGVFKEKAKRGIF
jgi:hypothetical protein